MTLYPQDAYALRSAIALQPLPAGLTLSPLVEGLLASLDWKHNDQHRQFLENIVARSPDLLREVMAAPPPSQHDHAYIADYIAQVTTKVNMSAPDLDQANGSGQVLCDLHRANQEDGPDAARRLWQHLKIDRPDLAALETPPSFAISTFDGFLDGHAVSYLDTGRAIQAGEITAIVGQPGSGKSFWTLARLAELADTMPVVYVAAEGLNPDRLWALRAARQGQSIAHTKTFSDNFQIVAQPVDLTSDAAVDSFVQAVARFRPKVIAVDTFAACTAGIDENASQDIQPVMNRIRERIIGVLGCAVLLIHHTTKDGKQFRGSSALRANVANMYYLLQEDGVITLRSDKQRDAEPAPDRHHQLVRFFTRKHPETGEDIYSAAILPLEKVIDDPTVSLTKNQRGLMEALESFENGLTTRAIEDATGMAKATLWRNIQKLVKVGYLVTGEKGEPIYLSAAGRGVLLNQI